MAKQTINYGTTAGDGTGENLFSAFKKAKENFDELYGAMTEFVANAAALPAAGETGKIYLALDTGLSYRWTGAAYALLSPNAVQAVTGPNGVVSLLLNGNNAPIFGQPAEAHGVSQLKTAAQNATALAAACANGGLVTLTTPGEYLSNLFTGPSGTPLSIYLGEGVELKLGNNANSPLFNTAAYSTYMLGAGATVTITSAGNVATVAWTAHGKSVGDFIWNLGADQPDYNGVWRVDTVPDADHLTFKFNAGSATTPATGTIKAGLADQVTIWGEGTINGNSANQSFVGDSPNKNLINMMNVAHSQFKLKRVKNQSRYGVFIANSLNSGGSDVDFFSTALGQDGFHVCGPQRGQCKIENITGSTGDDLISLMTGDIVGWGVPSGDTENIIVNDVTLDSGLTTIVKIDGAPISGTRHKNIQLNGVHGNAPAQGVLAMVYTTGALLTYTIDKLAISNVNCRPKSGYPLIAMNSITVDHATVDGVQANFTNMGVASVFRSFGSTVNLLNVNDVKVSGQATGSTAVVDMDSTSTYGDVNITNTESTGDTSGNIFRADGPVTSLRLNNVHKSGGGNIVTVNAGCTSTPALQFDNVRQGAGVQGVVINANATLDSKNFRSASAIQMVTVNAGKTLTWIGDAANDNNPSHPHLVNNGGTVNVNGPTIRVDVTAVARVDGAMIYNTNAAAGTLGVAGLVVCQGTASGSWHLMSDPTKVY